MSSRCGKRCGLRGRSSKSVQAVQTVQIVIQYYLGRPPDVSPRGVSGSEEQRVVIPVNPGEGRGRAGIQEVNSNLYSRFRGKDGRDAFRTSEACILRKAPDVSPEKFILPIPRAPERSCTSKTLMGTTPLNPLYITSLKRLIPFLTESLSRWPCPHSAGMPLCARASAPRSNAVRFR